MNPIVKKSIPHVIAIVIFVILTCVFFAPAIFEGKTLRQSDMQQMEGMGKELSDYYQKEGGKSAWTGSMFSGMPAYHIYVHGNPPNFLAFLEKPVKAIDYQGASIVLTGLICFYILMCVMGINSWLAIAGSIAFAFASYNIIIIIAGHITKAYVIALMPLTVAGLCLIFKEKWLLGAALTTLGIALSVRNSHIQITYYLALFCIFLFLAYLVQQIKNKEYLKPAKTTGLLLICILIAVLPNLGSMYSQYEYSKESMRGASELTPQATSSAQRISTGLDIDYAFAWSYGKAETMTLLIPNFHGGASVGELGRDSELYKAMRANRMQVGKTIQTYTYWGDQPGTSGPVYFGALVCFLFVLGMFVIKNPVKWWILGATIFFVFLSWGRNFMVFNEFLFHYLPMYNKFRTVSMALVIPGMIFPIIGIWGLKTVLSQKVEKKKLLKAFYWSFGLTGGLCLVFWLIPGVFLNFQSANDAQFQFPDWYYNALLADRESLLKADVFRSLAFIVLGATLIFWFIKAKNPTNVAKYVVIGIAVLILVDLWTVGKRFINHESFVSKKEVVSARKPSVADNFILQDTDPSFRVLNLNNPFNESYTSYFHKSIGGYHAAKMGRYQELIDHWLVREINSITQALQQAKTYEDLENMTVFQHTPTLNMLNTRYVIFSPEQPPIINPNAFGNAWFVNNHEIVENADAEMTALHRINPLETAVIDKRFAQFLDGFSFQKDENATIEMISYEPVRVRYKSSVATDQLVVFSEIYYPHGWEATIDGKPVEHFRVNWTLRAMIIPAGEHIIQFEFVPRNYTVTTKIASISSLFILLLLITAIGWSGWNYLRKNVGE
jgi:hypothetical protein